VNKKCITFALVIKKIRIMTTRIILSENKKYYDVWYSIDGVNYKLHKGGFKSIDSAIKESTIITGSNKLLRDILMKN
jgi:transposase